VALPRADKVNTRNQSLDVLRGIAVLLVICDHYPLVPIMKAGWIGVDLFFVLSGFLISGLLFQEYKQTGSIRIGRFIVRRGFKIWPAFYVFLGIMYVLTRIVSPHASMKGFETSALFVFSYFPRLGPAFLGPLWSLSVEEHFYIFLPLLLLVLVSIKRSSDARHAFRAIPAIFIAISICCFALRLLTPESSALIVNRASHLRADSLFAGVALAYCYYFKPDWFSRLGRSQLLLFAALCIVPALLLPEESRFVRTMGLTLNWIGLALLLAWAVPRRPKSVAFRIIAKIGFYSYSIYLWHRGLSVVVGLTLGENSILGFALYVASALLLGIIMAKAVELPMLRVREKLFRSRKAEIRFHQIIHAPSLLLRDEP
jgi:peptidoglycan/LPS O-acetylase OafA/YrhL